MAETTQPASGEWKHGKFDCCDDVKDCLCAYCCSPCYSYQATLAAGESQMCAIGAACFPIILICVRGNAREKKGIEGSMLNDCCSMYWCGLCTLIQLKREFDE